VPGKKLLLVMLALLVLAVLPFIVIPTLIRRGDHLELPDLGTVTPFALLDEQGQAFTEDALRGHPTIVNFAFTRCDTICPITSLKMQRLQDKLLDRRAVPIKLMTVSVDPTYDTPARLAVYAQRFGALADKWRFVTGPEASVKALVEGPFMNSMILEGQTPTGAPAISHNGYFVLVDGDLRIRGVYDSNEVQKLDDLLRHARYLARTAGSYKFGGS
jgi:protein SCO1/2